MAGCAGGVPAADWRGADLRCRPGPGCQTAARRPERPDGRHDDTPRLRDRRGRCHGRRRNFSVLFTSDTSSKVRLPTPKRSTGLCVAIAMWAEWRWLRSARGVALPIAACAGAVCGIAMLVRAEFLAAALVLAAQAAWVAAARLARGDRSLSADVVRRTGARDVVALEDAVGIQRLARGTRRRTAVAICTGDIVRTLQLRDGESCIRGRRPEPRSSLARSLWSGDRRRLDGRTARSRVPGGLRSLCARLRHRCGMG